MANRPSRERALWCGNYSSTLPLASRSKSSLNIFPAGLLWKPRARRSSSGDICLRTVRPKSESGLRLGDERSRREHHREPERSVAPLADSLPADRIRAGEQRDLRPAGYPTPAPPKKPNTIYARLRFLQSALCHPNYAIVWLNVHPDEAALYARRLLRHPEFSTQRRRLGKVIRVHWEGISFFQRLARGLTHLQWRD
jgi:hypothetical protein